MIQLRYAAAPLDVLRELMVCQVAKAAALYREVFP
jgi:hypothetical protein